MSSNAPVLVSDSSDDDDRPLVLRLAARRDDVVRPMPEANKIKRKRKRPSTNADPPVPEVVPRRRSRRTQPATVPNICHAPVLPAFAHRGIPVAADGGEDRPHGARDVLLSLALGTAHGLPSHAQHTAEHCTPYALWNAAEVVLGRALPEPAFISMKVNKTGMSAGLSMQRLLDRRDAARFLRDSGLRARPVQVIGRGKHGPILLSALQEGVLLVGGTVGMATYHSVHHRGQRVPKSWEGVRIPGWAREGHSFVVVGSVDVIDHGRSLIVRDSQTEDVFGVNGCAILPLSQFEGELGECFVLTRA